MFHHNIIKHYVTSLTDVVLKLVDESDNTEVLTIEAHRIILSLLCPFFAKLFGEFRESKETEVVINVPNINVASDIIMSFYGEQNNRANLPEWLHVFEWVKCADYFGLDIDTNIVVAQTVPTEYFGLLIDVVELIGCNSKIFRWIERNMPINYDLNTLPLLVMKQLSKYANQLYFVTFNSDHGMELWHGSNDKCLDFRCNLSTEDSIAITDHRQVRLAIIDLNSLICFYHVAHNSICFEKSLQLDAFTHTVCFSLDDESIIVGRNDNITIYRISDGTATIVLSRQHTACINVIYQITADRMLTVMQNAQINIWDLYQSKLVEAINVLGDSDAHYDIITNISTDQTYVIICINTPPSSLVKIFQTQSHTFCYQFIHEGDISACCLSHDNKLMCLGDSGCAITLYHLDQEIKKMGKISSNHPSMTKIIG